MEPARKAAWKYGDGPEAYKLHIYTVYIGGMGKEEKVIRAQNIYKNLKINIVKFPFHEYICFSLCF